MPRNFRGIFLLFEILIISELLHHKQQLRLP